MRRIDSDSFNRKIVGKIEEPHNRLGKIAFENVNVIEDKFQGIGNGADTIDVKFSDLATVDGVEMAKVNGALRYLEGSKTATLDIFEVVRIAENSVEDRTNERSYSGKFNIPPQYDGRNSYVEVVYGDIPEEGIDADDFQSVAPNFTDEYVLNLSVNAENKAMVQKSVFKTENYIKVKSKLSSSALDTYSAQGVTLCLYIHIYLWRYV